MSWIGEFIKKSDIRYAVGALFFAILSFVIFNNVIISIGIFCVAFLSIGWIHSYILTRSERNKRIRKYLSEREPLASNLAVFYFGLPQKDKDMILNIYRDKKAIPNKEFPNIRVLNKQYYDLEYLISLFDRVKFQESNFYAPICLIHSFNEENLTIEFHSYIVPVLEKQ